MYRRSKIVDLKIISSMFKKYCLLYLMSTVINIDVSIPPLTLLLLLLLLFCSLLLRPVNRFPETDTENPVVEEPVYPTEELPEHVSSDEDDIEGKDFVECVSDILSLVIHLPERVNNKCKIK